MSRVQFDKLPLWKGVQDKPGSLETFPFSLGWDQRGVICQTTPVEVRNQVIQAYSSDEYSFITQPPGFSEWADHLGNIYSDFILRTCGKLAGKSVLEVGAASQHLAEKIAGSYQAAEYWIFDPAIKESAKLPNIQIRREYYSEESCPEKRFDLIISLNCLEHVPDPFAFLAAIRKSIAPGGKAVLVFPDNERQFLNGDLNAVLHEHLTYYTPKICMALFASSGFRILEWNTKNDTFSAVIEPAGDSQVEVCPEDEILVTAQQRFNSVVRQTTNDLKDCLSRNERVAFHGATNGLNNLLVLSSFHEQENFFVFDGDRAKTGKYLPACKSAIRHFTDPEYKKIDRVFISALTYYDEIRKNLRDVHLISDSQIQPIGVSSAGLLKK